MSWSPLLSATGSLLADPPQSNRHLILDKVGSPEGLTLTAVSDVSNEDDDEEVTGVTTTLSLPMGLPATPTIDAWRAANPGAAGPSAELDAAFDTDLYRPVWRRLDHIMRRLDQLGFERTTDYQTHASLHTRTVGYERRGVTVWLGAQVDGGRITVYRSR